ncbi:hypothetical protein EVAR_35891_1 [Eumeta japonica]|uniref:Uncharacterized protein n=1 Tax=Eumeta variegata TaxID=151549 RepID=A0A4C1WWT4_EUMVA|nr:hypothetical protein EVAR_35891_1 [Eumeta japonica]
MSAMVSTVNVFETEGPIGGQRSSEHKPPLARDREREFEFTTKIFMLWTKTSTNKIRAARNSRPISTVEVTAGTLTGALNSPALGTAGQSAATTLFELSPEE